MAGANHSAIDEVIKTFHCHLIYINEFYIRNYCAFFIRRDDVLISLIVA